MTDDGAAACCVAALVAEMQALEAVLQAIDDRVYVHAERGGSPIGAHIRHIVDHIRAVIAGAQSGVVDYEQRHRGSRCEHDRSLGLHELQGLRQALAALSAEQLAQPVTVNTLVSAHLAPQSYPSTILREVLFLISHQNHHQAIIATLAAQQGISVDPLFGLAPSTRAAVLATES